MPALRIALIAVFATLLLADLGLTLGQAPDCTTRKCMYLPLVSKPAPPLCTPSPTEVSFVTDTPTRLGATGSAPASSPQPCTSLPTETTEPPWETATTPTPSATPTVTPAPSATSTVSARR